MHVAMECMCHVDLNNEQCMSSTGAVTKVRQHARVTMMHCTHVKVAKKHTTAQGLVD